MKSCDFYEICELFNQERASNMPRLVSMFKVRYCQGDPSQCARYKVSKEIGRQHVPEFMLPTQIEWAQQIIKEQKDEQDSIAAKQNSSSLCKK